MTKIDCNDGGGQEFDTYPLYPLGFFKKEKTKNIITPVDVKNIKML